MQKIKPCLWFNNNAEEAMNFYFSVFKNTKVLDMMRCGKAGPGPEGSVLVVTFELDGQEFMALNGGPNFQFNEAVSFFVNCETQDEVDHFWAALSAGGSEGQCGWLKDKFGVSWQIVPKGLPELLREPAAMQAMMKMKKLDLAALKQAASH